MQTTGWSSTGGNLADVVPDTLAGDGHGVAVEEAGFQQPLHYQGYAAIAVQVGHDVTAARLHVGDIGGVPADAVEIGQAQVDPGLVGDGHQVQDHVGGAAHGNSHGDGVLECLPGEDIPGAHVLGQHGRIRACPARRLNSDLRGSGAGMEASPGKDMPRTSMAVDMVLAVNSPAQEPSPGQACRSKSRSSSRDISFLA